MMLYYQTNFASKQTNSLEDIKTNSLEDITEIVIFWLYN